MAKQKTHPYEFVGRKRKERFMYLTANEAKVLKKHGIKLKKAI
jgi:hypothetical protein